ncbi:tail fiber assembly protein [Escherichia coli]|uniref:tail fiber assembly protein n=1 Tax=Escherichia coli TaxID=562 RepID=UPI0032D9DF7F
MDEYVYSARHNAFFPVDMIDKYKSEGWDLSDAKEVNQNIISEFMAEPPQGKIRIAGDDGLPAWADIPPPTHEELIEITESERQLLINPFSYTHLRAPDNSLQLICRLLLAKTTKPTRLQYEQFYSICRTTTQRTITTTK